MGLLDTIKAWTNWSTKATSIAPSMKVAYNSATFTAWQYDKLVLSGYMRNVIVYRCVELGCQLFSQVPWVGNNTKDKRLQDNHPVMKLLKRPNPFQSGIQFRHQARAHLRLHGNVYIEKVRALSRDGSADNRIVSQPVELYVIPPERMTIETNDQGIRYRYKYEWQGFTKYWEIDPVTGESDVLHVKRFHPTNDFYGFGDLMPSSRSTDTWNSIVEYNKTLLDNSGNPPGMFSIKQGKDEVITPQQMEQFKINVESYYGGPKNAGKPIVAPNVEYTAMAWSPKDMEWNASKESVAKDICIAFGVPYVLLNMTDSTFANAEEARLSYFEDQILPELELFREEMSWWLQKDFPNVDIDFDPNVLPFMVKKLEARYNAIENMSLALTINEIRELFDFAPIDGFDYIKGAKQQDNLDNHGDPVILDAPQPGNELPTKPNPLKPADSTTQPASMPANMPAEKPKKATETSSKSE